MAVVKRAQAKEKTLERPAGRGEGRQLRRRAERAAHAGHAADRVGNAQFTLLDVKRIISAAAIDAEALAAEQSERKRCQRAAHRNLDFHLSVAERSNALRLIV